MAKVVKYSHQVTWAQKSVCKKREYEPVLTHTSQPI